MYDIQSFKDVATAKTFLNGITQGTAVVSVDVLSTDDIVITTLNTETRDAKPVKSRPGKDTTIPSRKI